MVSIEEFALSRELNKSDITHFLHIGSRQGCDVYAFGYWVRDGYTCGIATYDGSLWLFIHCTDDLDPNLQRIICIDDVHMNVGRPQVVIDEPNANASITGCGCVFTGGGRCPIHGCP